MYLSIPQKDLYQFKQIVVMDTLDPAIMEPILSAQQDEITEYYIYEALSQKTKNSQNPCR